MTIFLTSHNSDKQLRVKTIAYVLCSLLLSLQTVSAQTIQPVTTSTTFDFTEFGSKPDTLMECIRRATFNDFENQETVYSSYTRQSDAGQFHDLTITQPVYDFCDEELFRIRFRLAVEDQEPEEALEALGNILEKWYQMTFVHEETQSTSEHCIAHKWVFKSSQDIVAEVSWKRYGGCWDMPIIKVQKSQLINKLNKAMNPDYISKAY
ncbi:hypothetical protein [Desulfuromonas acetoxidans]|uniref:hypothetical protein n=1 Tax=Desulfuromonas acetoxidans TaxID=891 RepID=UPI00292E2272